MQRFFESVHEMQLHLFWRSKYRMRIVAHPLPPFSTAATQQPSTRVSDRLTTPERLAPGSEHRTHEAHFQDPVSQRLSAQQPLPRGGEADDDAAYPSDTARTTPLPTLPATASRLAVLVQLEGSAEESALAQFRDCVLTRDHSYARLSSRTPPTPPRPVPAGAGAAGRGPLGHASRGGPRHSTRTNYRAFEQPWHVAKFGSVQTLDGAKFTLQRSHTKMVATHARVTAE
jgi:hypothetical protein